jgi:glucose-6-phosphate 1-dehydrogenase
VIDAAGNTVEVLKDGDFFGEVGLLLSTPRTATVRARSLCDLLVLKKADFSRILREHPQFAESMLQVAKERYELAISVDELMTA